MLMCARDWHQQPHAEKEISTVTSAWHRLVSSAVVTMKKKEEIRQIVIKKPQRILAFVHKINKDRQFSAISSFVMFGYTAR